jgi:ArsR family transcriptional regulator
MQPEQLFNLLSDPTRLRALLLIRAEGEVCVCELTHALEESQPKISRHLAPMRDAGLLTPRREGTWVHYSLAGDLPRWASATLETTVTQLRDRQPFADDRARLQTMLDRPGGKACA